MASRLHFVSFFSDLCDLPLKCLQSANPEISTCTVVLILIVTSGQEHAVLNFAFPIRRSSTTTLDRGSDGASCSRQEHMHVAVQRKPDGADPELHLLHNRPSPADPLLQRGRPVDLDRIRARLRLGPLRCTVPPRQGAPFRAHLPRCAGHRQPGGHRGARDRPHRQLRDFALRHPPRQSPLRHIHFAFGHFEN